jgi:hypothetical protein
MTRAVVPHMRRHGGGRIINIGSVLGFLPMPYGALYAATKHAIEGYSESLDHELRTRGIRVSVIEPAYTKTPFGAHFLEPDAKIDEYRTVRAAVSARLKEVMATADQPQVVADVVLRAASAAHPKLRYPAGAAATRLRLLRRFAPAGVMDAGIRRDLRLGACRTGLNRDLVPLGGMPDGTRHTIATVGSNTDEGFHPRPLRQRRASAGRRHPRAGGAGE